MADSKKWRVWFKMWSGKTYTYRTNNLKNSQKCSEWFLKQYPNQCMFYRYYDQYGNIAYKSDLLKNMGKM